MLKNYPKRFWLTLFVCLVFFSMSCNLLNHFNHAGKTVPGSTLTAPSEIGSGLKDVQGNTDDEGIIRFDLGSAESTLSLKVIDQSSQDPLSDIQVNYFIKDQKVLLVATDPAEKYLPAVKEVSLLQPGGRQSDSSLNVISLNPASGYLQNFNEWQDYVGNVQDINAFSIETQSKCINPDQTQKGIRALIGNSAILLSGTNSSGEAIQQGIRLVAGEFDQANATSVLDSAIAAQTPAVLRWKIYKISDSLPYLIQPDGYCLEPLDSSYAQLVLQWIQYGVAYQDIYPFEKISGEDMQYVNYIEGGERIAREDFLSDLSKRLPNGAECAGILPYEEGSYFVFFDKWSPAWQMDQSCYSDCKTYDPPYESAIAGFMIDNFTDKGKYTLGKVWVNKPDLLLDAYHLSMEACNLQTENNDSDGSNSGATTVATTTGSCPNAPAQRMTVGKQGEVCTKSDSVALRTDPKKGASVIARISRGGVFDVIGGPKCANDWSWWQIKLKDGTTGWISEGGDNEDKYFICPR